MKITWIGHACFKVEHNGVSVVLDPYSDGSVPGLLPVREQAGTVLCSHGHGDHNAAANVEIVKEVGEPFQIEKIDTYHDDKNGKLRGMNIIHILEKDGYKIIHFGDIGCPLTEEQVKRLTGADAVMMPVGGYYTVDAEEASQILAKINPKLIIPMHFSSNRFGFDEISTVDPFAARMPKAVQTGDSQIILEDWLPDKEGSTTILTPKNIA